MLLGLSMDHRTATYSQVFTTALHGASVHQKTPVLKFGVATALLFLQPDSELLSSLISPSSLRLWVGVGVGVGGSCLWSKQHFASPRVTLLVQTPALTLQSCQPACACVHQSGHASPGAGGGGSVVREGARELLGGEGPRPHADREVLLGVQSRPSVSEGGSMRMVLILLSRSWGLWRGVDASGRGGGVGLAVSFLFFYSGSLKDSSSGSGAAHFPDRQASSSDCRSSCSDHDSPSPSMCVLLSDVMACDVCVWGRVGTVVLARLWTCSALSPSCCFILTPVSLSQAFFVTSACISIQLHASHYCRLNGGRMEVTPLPRRSLHADFNVVSK